MSCPGGLVVRVKSPRSSAPYAVTPCWTLPIFAFPSKSYSIMMSIGDDLAVMQPRIAEALEIGEGQTVEFEILGTGESIFAPVTINDSICSDVLLHDFFALGIAESVTISFGGNVDEIVTKSGNKFSTEKQEMWAGLRLVQKKGTICLYFNGSKRSNIEGSAGHGFCIISEDGKELVRGYGYGGVNCDDHEMEYSGLIDGLHWAGRLDAIKLIIRGDSELTLNELKGVSQVRSPKLRTLHAEVKKLLKKIKKDAVVEFEQLSRDENVYTDRLANLGIDTKQNLTACNWQNVNRFMRG